MMAVNFTAIIAVFLGFSDVDDGTIVGSALFNILYVMSCNLLEKRVHSVMTKIMLNTDHPSMVPSATSLKPMNTAMIEGNSSGTDLLAAIK